MRVTYILILVFLSLSACSNKAKRNAKTVPQEKIVSADPRAQAEFDAAVMLLKEGRYESAVDAFQSFQATYPSDTLADVAELYLGRALIQANRQQFEQGAALLERLSRDRNVDPRIRWAATSYRALGLEMVGAAGEALLSLQSYPGASMSPLVLQRDLGRVWALIAEALNRSGRFDESLVAYAELYRVDSERTEFATSRGFEIAVHLKDNELEAMSNDKESEFLRAVGGTTLLERWLDQPTTQRQRRSLRVLLSRIETDLASIDALDRGDLLDKRIDAFGPSQKVVLGVVLPLSGPNTRLGERTLQSVLLAVDAFSAKQNNVTLLVKDSSEDADKVFRFFDKEGAGFVIGPLDVTRAKSFAAKSLEYEIPMLALAQLPRSNGWAFSMFVDAPTEAKQIAALARKQENKTVTILVPDIAYGKSMAKTFRETFEASGGTVTMQRSYKRETTDFTKIAKAVAASKTDAIFIPDTGDKVAEISSFLANSNVWGYGFGAKPDSKRTSVHYFGTSLWYGKGLKQSAKYLEGAQIPVWAAREFSSESSLAFYRSFDGSVKREPTVIDVFAYDATSIAIEACDSADKQTDPREWLLQNTFEPGATGVTRKEGDRISTDLKLVRLENGAFSAAQWD